MLMKMSELFGGERNVECVQLREPHCCTNTCKVNEHINRILFFINSIRKLNFPFQNHTNRLWEQQRVARLYTRLRRMGRSPSLALFSRTRQQYANRAQRATEHAAAQAAQYATEYAHQHATAHTAGYPVDWIRIHSKFLIRELSTDLVGPPDCRMVW